MSNTKRKDYYIEANGSPLFGDEWKATADRKKWYKPSKKNKDGQLKKIRPVTRPKIKNAMQRPDEDGEVILPVDKKTDIWYYN
jgi:hypothetical protein